MPINTSDSTTTSKVASSTCPSPPPSPSRNSIFDQSWLVEAGPNIASAYPKRAQSSIFVPLPLSPSSAPRHAATVAPASKAQQPTMTLSPVSGSTTPLFGSLDTRSTPNNLQQRLSSSSPSSAAARSDSEQANSGGRKHWKPSDMWTTAAAAVATTTPTVTTTTTTGITTPSSPLRRTSTLSHTPSMPAVSLKLAKSKSSFLGNGRHAEVYKGSVQRVGPAWDACSTSPKNLESAHVHLSADNNNSSLKSTRSNSTHNSTMTSLAPQTLLGLASLAPPSSLSQQQDSSTHHHQLITTTTSNNNNNAASWTLQDPEQQCAAKCLFSDDESQQVGWTEASLLQSLQTADSTHPGRERMVSLLGVFDQATQSGFSADDQESFAFHQSRLDRISSHSPPAPPSAETKPEWVLLLEYCSQGSLWDWVQRHPEQVGLELWLTWAIQLAQAVDFIHSERLVHHDIKPHNVMLASTLDAKLSDFGAGRRVEDPSVGLTDGLGRGTPPYSAPEIFNMNKTYSYPIDIYSLGVTLYVAGLTAQEPFSKLKSVVEMMVWVKKGGFWQWEEQGWIHDRGPVPKKTSQSQASVSSAAAAAAAASAHHAQLEARSGPYPYGQLWGSLSNSSLSSLSSVADSQHAPTKSQHHPLPPLNTHGLSVVTQQPTPGPLTSSPNMASFPTSPQDSLRSRSPSFSSTHLAAPMLSMVTTTPSSPPTFQTATVSPPSSCPSSPLPQPMRKELPLHHHHHHHHQYRPSPRSRPPSQQNLSDLASGPTNNSAATPNGTVWRFLNGEPVDGAIVALLKTMCHPDPQQRPTAAQVVVQLEEIQDRLVMAMQCD